MEKETELKQHQLERIKVMAEAAAKAGMDINYSPEIVFDTMTVSNEDWENSMKDGIGASEAGAVMNASKYSSPRQLALKKLGQLKDENVTAAKQYVFDYGHAMESVLLTLFSSVMEFNVYTDRNRYRHPLYPWMFCDLDGVAKDKDDMRVIVECKTTSSMQIQDWTTGTLGKGGVCPVQSYVWQVTHQMAVMNYDRAYIIVGCGNNAGDVRIVRVDRDFDREYKLISNEKVFWSNLKKGIIPEISESISTSEYDRERRGKDIPAKELTDDEKSDLLSIIEEMKFVDEQKASLKEAMDELDNQNNALKLSLIEKGGLQSGDVIEIPNSDGLISKISYKPNKPTATIDKDQLKLQHPDIYNELEADGIIHTVEHDPVLKVTSRKPRKKKAAA